MVGGDRLAARQKSHGRPVLPQEPRLHRSQAVVALVAFASALVLAACVTPAPTGPTTTATRPVPEPPPSAYIQMLRGHGIKAAIPSRGKFILVNIPSYELIALQDGSPVLRSRVVVGQPATRTPELLSSMSAVRFNPAWTPTPSMIRNEAAHYIPPGPFNPLGRLMFELDNDQFIFLHDTNQKGLFKQARRAFSHGCIRVEQARPLAAWALGVTEGEVDKMIARGATWSMPLPEEIPVFLVYYPQFPDESGQLATWPDIYANWEAEERAYLERAAARRRFVPKPPEQAAPPSPSVPTDRGPPSAEERAPPGPSAREAPQSPVEEPTRVAPVADPAPAVEPAKPGGG
jgi:lipoprotein-anchoring transpeptidase ErfK/SrfK